MVVNELVERLVGHFSHIAKIKEFIMKIIKYFLNFFLLLTVLITNSAYSMLPENISIVDSPCLHKQTISVPLERDTVKCFLGVGVLNSKSKVSLYLPLDILIPLGAIQNLVDEFKHQGKDFSVDILLADKMASSTTD